jgi:hypothetical protein
METKINYFSKYCKTNEYIDKEIEDLKSTTFSCFLIRSYEFRIKTIHEFEESNKIKPFSSDFNNIENWNLSDDLYEKIKFSFNYQDKKPEHSSEFKKFYFGLLNNLFGELGILEKKNNKKKNIYKYSFDETIITKYLKLYGYTDPLYENFDADVLKRFFLISTK